MLFITASRRKLRFSSLALLVLLLAIGSITFGAISYSASNAQSEQNADTITEPENEHTNNFSNTERFNIFSNGAKEYSIVNIDPEAAFTVNSSGDTIDAMPGNGICADAAGECTLRAAIQEANATSGADIINFALTTPATIQLNSTLTPAELVISETVTINGPGARLLTVRGNANTALGIFNITSAVTTSANINSLTIADSGSRGLNVDGKLNISDAVVKGNSIGIYNTGELNVSRVLIENNSGGGLFLTAPAVVNISNTTITNNTSANGGGIHSKSANVTLNNVTISHNTATGSAPNGNGGGFYYDNTTALGPKVRNTVIAQNTASTAGPDIFSVSSAPPNNAKFESKGNNLVGKSAADIGFVHAANNDKVGTLAAPIDPLLGPLQNNGGLIDTRALLDTSPARDAGNNCVTNSSCTGNNPTSNLTTDQRGTNFPRLYDSTVDMGAFESFYPVATIASFAPVNRGTGTGAFELTVNGTNFVANSQVKWNGQDRTTTFVSNAQIKAQITAADITNAGQFPIIVSNPTPGGGPSASSNFTVADCTYSINPVSQTFTAAGGTGSVAVTAPSGCQWTAASNDPFITVTGGTPGNGSGTVSFSVSANTGLARNGTITIGGQTFTVNQANGCVYTLNPTSATITTAAGNYSFALTTSNPNCTWTVADDAPWITVTNTGGANSATINYSVTANTGIPRTGIITVSGAVSGQDQTFTVNQNNGCTYALNPTSATHPAGAAAYSVALTTSDPACTWTATDDASWITVTNASGTGSATINYTLDANTGLARNGKITVNGQELNISQANGCTFTLNPTSANFPAAGGANNTFTITAGNQSCTWTAVPNQSWITINSGASGTGNGTVNYTIASNNGPERPGKIIINGHTEFNITQSNGCTYSINPVVLNASAAGGNSNFNITTSDANCAWTAAVEPSASNWLTITSGTSGTGPGTISFTVAPNNGLARSGKITAGGQEFTVNQANGCVYTLTPTNQSFPNTGATGATFAVGASNQNCTWTAVRNDNWLTITNGASGTGNGTVTFDVAANTGVARAGTITVSGAVGGQNQIFTANQAIGCSYTLSANSLNAAAAGGTGNFNVTTAGGCGWTAVSNAPWITINSGTPGSGSGTLGFTVSANIGLARTGTITITGAAPGQTYTFTVNQANGCVYTLTPTAVNAAAAGGNGSFDIATSDPACTWTTTVTPANASWVSISSGTSGTGPGTVNFSVGANNGLARSGTITVNGAVAGQIYTFTINQANGCVYTLTPTSATQPAGAGNYSFALTTSNPNCTWTVADDAPWITVTNTGGANSATINYSLTANAGIARTGTITVTGAVPTQTAAFSVTQANGCTYALNPTSATHPAGAAAYSVALTTSDPACTWTATDDASWITVTNASGTGSATINYTLDANTGLARNGKITVNGQELNITQANGCVYTLTPASRDFPNSGGTNSFALTTSNQNCTWTASRNGTWITITSSTTGTGNSTINFDVAANNGMARVGGVIITGAVQTQVVTGLVNQANGCTYTLNPTNQSFPSAGGTNGAFAITASNQNCTWTAAPNDNWVNITGAANGTGNGSVNFSVAANVEPARSMSIIVSGAVSGQNYTFTVNQASGCTYTLTPSNTSFDPAGGNGSFNITTNTQTCSWTASPTQNWITIIGTSSGTGNGTVSFNVQMNVSPQRPGDIIVQEGTITRATFNITQRDGCTYSLSPSSATFQKQGATNVTFNVNAGGGCQWTAVSNAAWITINSGTSGTGGGVVNYNVAANTDVLRSGTITVTGIVNGQPTTPRIFTVTQDNGCVITLNPITGNHPAGGTANASFAVTTSAPGCTWTAAVATANTSWVSITGTTGSPGSGTVNYSIALNTGPQRSGGIIVTGQADVKTFNIIQADGCTYTLSPASINISQIGGARSFNITTGNGCTWTTTANNPSWISITTAGNGTGNATVNVTISANSGDERIGTVSVNGASGQNVNFTVNQLNLVVTNANDSGTGSLRRAVANANLIPGNDIVTFQSNLTGNINLTGGEIQIASNGNLEIRGPGAENLQLSAGNNSRIFYIDNSIVTISGLTLTNGSGDGLNSTPNNKYGGAIYVYAGTLVLDRVNITRNTITVPQSQGNSGLGGGIYYFGGENHQIINSTISVNACTFGGGYYNQGGAVSVINSTISSNTAASEGGAIYSVGNTTIRNSTITENRAVATGHKGGGIMNEGGTLNFGNSIISRNTGPEITFNNGNFISVGNSLIGDMPGDANDTKNFVIYHPTDIKDVQPKLAALGYFGGGTPTHPLLPNSPAINAGNDTLSPSTTDQRGSTRIINGTIDIGAYEFNILLSPIPSNLPTATVGVQYYAQLTGARADGSNPSEQFEYFVVDGFLPAGIHLTQDGGLITGNPTPEAGGPYQLTIKAVGTDRMAGVNTYNLSVNCSYTVSPNSQNLPSTSGNGTFNITSAPGCTWTVANANQWITPSPTSGSGNATINYAVTANTGPARSGVMTIGNQQFTVNQDNGCTFNLNPNSADNVPAAGTNGSFNISTIAGCGWTASSSVSWITVNSGASGTGSGAVNFTVSANSGQPRSGKITVTRPNGTPAEFNITQSSGCSYSLSPSSQNFPIGGGTNSFTVNTAAGCAWTAAVNPPTATWISITAGSSGSGPGSIQYSVAANTGAQRSATINAGGQIFTVNQAGTSRTLFDFDGDGKSDQSVYRPTDGAWYLLRSTEGFTGTQFGISTDKIAPGDYDGDGKTDIAVFRNGAWYLLRSQLGFTYIQFGTAGDLPVPADYDGDGKSDICVFRPSNGSWYRLNSSTGEFVGVQFGANNDIPAPADFDGDGKADLNVYRRSDGGWYRLNSTNGQFVPTQFGIAEDFPAPADFDGDRKADICVFRPSNGGWYRLNSTNGQFVGISFGASGDVPTTGDYDGDGKSDIAVFRASTGNWFRLNSTNGQFVAVQFGAAGDKPVPTFNLP